MYCVIVAIVIVKLIKKVIQRVPSPQQMVYVLYSTRHPGGCGTICTGATLLSWFGPGKVYTSFFWHVGGAR